MSLIIPPGYGVASIVLEGPVGTQPYVTTIGVDLSDAGGDHVGAANNIFASYVSAFADITSQDLTLVKTSLLVGVDGASGSVDSTLEAVEGGNGEDMEPTSMALIVRKVTGSLGRSGRGRMFIPGVLAKGDTREDGSVGSVSLGIYQARATQFRDNLLNADPNMTLIPVLLHSDTSPVQVPFVIQALSANNKVGWIRGRIR